MGMTIHEVRGVDAGAARIINDAIEEVWEAYRECGNTTDGVVDFGESMQALGRMVNRDLAAEAEAAGDEGW